MKWQIVSFALLAVLAVLCVPQKSHKAFDGISENQDTQVALFLRRKGCRGGKCG